MFKYSVIFLALALIGAVLYVRFLSIEGFVFNVTYTDTPGTTPVVQVSPSTVLMPPSVPPPANIESSDTASSGIIAMPVPSSNDNLEMPTNNVPPSTTVEPTYSMLPLPTTTVAQTVDLSQFYLKPVPSGGCPTGLVAIEASGPMVGGCRCPGVGQYLIDNECKCAMNDSKFVPFNPQGTIVDGYTGLCACNAGYSMYGQFDSCKLECGNYLKPKTVDIHGATFSRCEK